MDVRRKGGDPGPGHAGRGALLDDVLHGHGGQGRLGGGEAPTAGCGASSGGSQTGWPAAGEGQSRADLVGFRGLGAPGYGGHGQ